MRYRGSGHQAPAVNLVPPVSQGPHTIGPTHFNGKKMPPQSGAILRSAMKEVESSFAKQHDLTTHSISLIKKGTPPDADWQTRRANILHISEANELSKTDMLAKVLQDNPDFDVERYARNGEPAHYTYAGGGGTAPLKIRSMLRDIDRKLTYAWGASAMREEEITPEQLQLLVQGLTLREPHETSPTKKTRVAQLIDMLTS
jgi:hypothetical protein